MCPAPHPQTWSASLIQDTKKILRRDRMMNADRLAVARLCAGLFDRVQGHPIPEEQLLALAGAFVLIVRALEVPHQDAFEAVTNLMTDETDVDDQLLPQFAAMTLYLKEDLING